MSDFKASNGIEIVERKFGLLGVELRDEHGANTLDGFDYLTPAEMQALREFFEDERDAGLDESQREAIATIRRGDPVAYRLIIGKNGDGLTLGESGSYVAWCEVYDPRSEIDRRLGRWRWPENPDFVVYEAWDELVVLRESTGDSTTFKKERVHGVAPDRWNAAAAAWFDAHPEPKPWEIDPRLGDAWEFTLKSGGKPILAIFDATDGGRWRWAATALPADFSDVASGRKVWPEATS